MLNEQEYKVGSCHCKSVEIKIQFNGSFSKLRRCNCSLCSKRWAVVASVPVDQLQVLKGMDVLRLYQWNTKVAKHYFCSICGVYTHHQRRSNPSEYGINIACFPEVNVLDYTNIPYIDGINHPKDSQEDYT